MATAITLGIRDAGAISGRSPASSPGVTEEHAPLRSNCWDPARQSRADRDTARVHALRSTCRWCARSADRHHQDVVVVASEAFHDALGHDRRVLAQEVELSGEIDTRADA